MLGRAVETEREDEREAEGRKEPRRVAGGCWAAREPRASVDPDRKPDATARAIQESETTTTKGSVRLRGGATELGNDSARAWLPHPFFSTCSNLSSINCAFFITSTTEFIISLR